MAKLGIMIEAQEGLTWEIWGDLIDTADRLGFDSLWRSDHLYSVMGVPDRDALALWPSLTMVAMRSERLHFGPLVSPVTFRHPVMLARNAAALDRLSNGRFELGVGAGWNEQEHKAFSFPLPPAGERMDMLDEALQVIDQLHSGDPFNYEGKHYRLENAQMRPTPTRPGSVPIVIGGKGSRRLLEIVARYADEWNITSGMSPTEYREMQPRLERFCTDAGRDPGSIKRSLMTAILVGRNLDDIAERFKRLQHFVPSLRQIPAEEATTRLRERGWLVGQPDEIVEQIQEWEQVGMQRFMLQMHDQQDLDALSVIAQDIMPQVSEAAEHYATGPGGDNSD